MTKVSKNEFFKRIYEGKLDVHPSIVSARFPYTSDWKFQRQYGAPLFGRTVDRIEGGLTVTDYFVAA